MSAQVGAEVWLQVKCCPSEHSTSHRDSLNLGALPTKHRLAWGDHRFGLLSRPSSGLFLSPVAEACLEAGPCARGGARTGEIRSLLEHKLCLCLAAVQHPLPTSHERRKSWLNSLSSLWALWWLYTEHRRVGG